MKLVDFLHSFNKLHKNLMNVEEENELKGSFDNAQEELTHLLSHLGQFTLEEQAQARLKMEEFATDLENRITVLRQRLNVIEQDSDIQQKRLKSIKAYGQGKIF